MADRATVFEGFQLAKETTPGVLVAATKKLQSMEVEVDPEATVQTFRPRGSKYETLAALAEEWVTGKMQGQPTFTEIVYPLSSAIDQAAITTPAGATNARQWLFDSAQAAPDNPATYTFELGSSVRAERFGFGLFTGFEIEWSRKGGLKMSGPLIGTALEDPIVLTASPTSLALIPILARQFDVYMDSTQGALGTTQLLRVVKWKLSIMNRFGPIWAADSSKPSWAGFVELPVTAKFEMTLAADAVGMGLLATMRNGDMKFLRVKATGGLIESGQNYLFQADIAGRVGEPAKRGDQDGLYACTWVFNSQVAPSWGKAFEIKVVNDLTSL